MRCTTWSRLQNVDVNIMAGLLASVFIHSKEWRQIYFQCKGVNPAQQQVGCSFEMMRQWFNTEHVPRKWAEKLVNSQVLRNSSDFDDMCNRS